MKQSILLIILGLILLSVVATIFFDQKGRDDVYQETIPQEIEEQGEQKTEPQETEVQKEQETEPQRQEESATPDNPSATTSAEDRFYQEYTEKRVEEALKRGDTTVLFFHASWCPTCRTFDRTVLSYSGETPEAFTLLKVDYDTASELRRRYKVTKQHTFIVLDEAKALKERIVGLSRFPELLERLYS